LPVISFHAPGNAYFNPYDNSLNFFRSDAVFRAGVKYRNTATPDLVVHELGHLLDASYMGISDRGFSEGLGDALVVCITGQPLVGRDIQDGERAQRDLRIPVDYRSDETDPHRKGWAFGGFIWDTIVSLGKMEPTWSEDQTRNYVRDLVLIANADNPANIPQAVELMFIADDQDDDIANGTQHSPALAAAAKAHGIKLPDRLPAPPQPGQ
jgi:hypothetical protein